MSETRQERLKVVFIDHSSERGGAELALVRLLRTSQPWNATVVVPPVAPGASDVFENSLSADMRIERTGPRHVARQQSGSGALASVGLAVKILASVFALVRSAAVRDADVLVANTTRASVFVAAAGAVTRTPYIVHIRDLITEDAIGRVATQLMRRFVLPRAAGVIANSRASLHTVLPYTRTSTVEVIPSPSGLHPVDPTRVDVPAMVARIGLVARIDPWKGQELLLRAFAMACREGEVRLVFVGGPSFGHDAFLRDLEALARKLGVEERVEFAGHRSDVAAAIDSLDICVQCSIRPEPLGQNVLQYLAAGKPTIVSGEGGPAEWVNDRHNGLVFAPRDVESLAASLRSLVDDAELRGDLARAAAATPQLLSDREIGALVHDVLRRSAKS